MYVYVYVCMYVYTYVHVHTCCVLIQATHTIYYVLAAVFASCFYVLFKFRFVREVTQGSPLVTSFKMTFPQNSYQLLTTFDPRGDVCMYIHIYICIDIYVYSFEFFGKDIRLDRNYGCFITMNPGYCVLCVLFTTVLSHYCVPIASTLEGASTSNTFRCS